MTDKRVGQMFVASACVAVLALAGVPAVALGGGGLASTVQEAGDAVASGDALGPLDRMHPWLMGAADPEGLLERIQAQGDGGVFLERLEHVLEDGSLQAIVSVHGRDAASEALVAQQTLRHWWYWDSKDALVQVDQDGLHALLESPLVRYVEPDAPLDWFMSVGAVDVGARGLLGDGSGLWAYDEGAGDMGALVPGAFDEAYTGADVTVAITDSGLDATHKDFFAWDCPEPRTYATCGSRVVENVVVGPTWWTVFLSAPDPPEASVLPTTDFWSGHGTHVAGTIAGNAFYTREGSPDPGRWGGDGHNFGVAPEADLVMVKAGDSLSVALATGALRWQVMHAEELDLRVSSNSWGCLGGCSAPTGSAVWEAMKDLYDAGVVVVFAVGNDGGGPNGASFSGYAQSPYVVAVAGYQHRNPNPDGTYPIYASSSRGQGSAPLPDPETWHPEDEPPQGHRRPDLAAPAVGVESARPVTGSPASALSADLIGGWMPRVNLQDTGLTGSAGFIPYTPATGTSMATPHVAGAAALLFSACPEATPLDVMRALYVGADPAKVAVGNRVAEPFEVGYGALDVQAAAAWLLDRDCDSEAPAAPPLSVDAGGPYSGGVGDAVVVTGNATGGEAPYGFAWSSDGNGVFGDASAAVTTYTAGEAGLHNLTLQVTDAGGNVSVAAAAFTAQDAPGGDSVAFTSPADGATVPAGAVTFTGTVQRGGDPGTAPTGSIQPADQTGDVGDALAFTATVTGDPAPACAWSLDGEPEDATFTTATDSCTGATVTSSAAQTVTVRFLVSNSAGSAEGTATATWSVPAGPVDPECVDGDSGDAVVPGDPFVVDPWDLHGLCAHRDGNDFVVTLQAAGGDMHDDLGTVASPVMYSVAFDSGQTFDLFKSLGSWTVYRYPSVGDAAEGVVASATVDVEGWGPANITLTVPVVEVGGSPTGVHAYSHAGEPLVGFSVNYLFGGAEVVLLDRVPASGTLAIAGASAGAAGTPGPDAQGGGAALLFSSTGFGPAPEASGTEHVALYVDGGLAGHAVVDTAAQASDSWTVQADLEAGQHNVTAEWYDADGLLVASAAIAVTATAQAEDCRPAQAQGHGTGQGSGQGQVQGGAKSCQAGSPQ